MANRRRSHHGHGPRGSHPQGPPAAKPKDGPGIKNPYVRFRPLVKPPLVKATTTLWDYPSQTYTKEEKRYRGATPSWVIWQVLEAWTKPGMLVVDPFAGSGTTLDVCKDLGRKGRGFDIAPKEVHGRDDVERADARKLPLQDRTVDLVFFDPPYANNLTYSGEKACIGKLAPNEWGQAMIQVVQQAKRVLKAGGHLAMFVSDILHARDNERHFHPLGLQLATIAEDAGLEMVEHVAVVRHGKALEDGPGKLQAQREGFLLRGFSHLVVFKKTA